MREHKLTAFRRLALGLAFLSLMLAAPLAAQPAPEPAGNAPATRAADPAPAPAPVPIEELAGTLPEDAPAEVLPGPGSALRAAPVAETTEPAAPETAAAPEPAAPAASTVTPEPAAPIEPPAPAAPVTAEPASPPPAEPAPVIAIPAPPPPAPLDPKDVTLRIASAGGAYMKSQELAFFQPFAKRTGYKVAPEAFEGTLAGLSASPGKWDVVDLDQDVAAEACRQGLLEPLDVSILQPAPDGASLPEDFLPGAIQPCAVAGTAWSAVLVYDKGMKATPAKAEHFFDLKKYPGKRALPRTPRHTLELALLGDGVPPTEVYAKLATPEGLDQAFRKLTAIKSQIVWWSRASEATDKIGARQAAMGLAFNGRAFMAAVKARQPVGVIWDHQIYHLNFWAVPKGAQFAGPAREFIGFATSTGPLADQTRWMPYGPARHSATRLAGKHAELNLDMKPHLPTTPANLQGALAFDSDWWAAQEPALKERFAAWLEGREATAESPTSQ